MITTFFTFSSEDITAMTGYSADLVGNFMPVIVVILGIGIALWIIDGIIHKR
jgi:hypothetical protein